MLDGPADMHPPPDPAKQLPMTVKTRAVDKSARFDKYFKRIFNSFGLKSVFFLAASIVTAGSPAALANRPTGADTKRRKTGQYHGEHPPSRRFGNALRNKWIGIRRQRCRLKDAKGLGVIVRLLPTTVLAADA